MGLTATELKDADIIIGKLQERCNAGRNCHVWRQKFSSRVFDDVVRRKLLERGAYLTLDRALTTLRTAEATRLQASTIKQSGAAPVHQLKTPAAKPHMGKPAIQHRDQQRGRPAAR
ncbi:hypothetical protein DAPPUDRAFT_260793 [Daphnia pulex]|uniref:Uncharacterized protein n=1 Tax=Daphnia pulex TaxID=6669 RepID=E9HJX3_DAPPU|nr:hypothetical protein DAPPUDRAFT_260793 [Daphnia pulex]|eukprot:EFX67966.1 hypothetical protein DAPPUDRAFT_260793 [Daphnia pulex]